jgi:hypothetical protein
LTHWSGATPPSRLGLLTSALFKAVMMPLNTVCTLSRKPTTSYAPARKKYASKIPLISARSALESAGSCTPGLSMVFHTITEAEACNAFGWLR